MEAMVKYVRLGRSGLEVSRICLGTMSFGIPELRAWVLDEADSRAIIRHSIDQGINFFDTADTYSRGASEEIVGRAIREFCKREDVVIATKLGLPIGDGPNQKGLSRKHIMTSIDASLRRLGTDYVDLYQIHRWDYNTPLEETLEALDDVVRAGKVRYLGASSMFAWQFTMILCNTKSRGLARFVSMQAQYNLAYREEEREMIPLCLAEGIGVIPWSPLARGFLSGTRSRADRGSTVRAKTDELEHRRYHRDADFRVLADVLGIAQQRHVAPAQVALAWVLSKPAVTAPIIGVTRIDQLQEAIKALDVSLSEAEISQIEASYESREINDHI
jgi:aryl-alcohol dehydrogenase (NADP+)